MKKRIVLLLALSAALVFSGCKKEEEAAAPAAPAPQIEVVNNTPAISIEDEEPAEVVEDDGSHEGMYRSELTNEWIDEALKDQRPIAAMVDNEKTALPHYGLSKYADVVYEMTNSLANDGITRLMVLVKDWEKIDQLGSIRSTRPTNLVIAPEWNAVVCHDGGPFYIDDYLAKPYVDNFSGTFSRIDNGKSREFTEYICTGDLDKNFDSKSNVSRTYNEYYNGGPHYQFVKSDSEINDLSGAPSVKDCTKIELPFKHNGSKLEYDPATSRYMYSEYGQKHTDPGNNNEQLGFTNVLLQNTRYVKFDDNGYMMFHAIDFQRDGWFITQGKAIPITWSKEDEVTPTRYYDKDGNEIVLNTGKTYVALIPDDKWGGLSVE
ncbi:MAG: DUF3048 domain-containing protein [Lachnospiraceae bacterium]|nr:DUF3048 domain-containing protein [Lachnospiraceae bacterium]